MRPEPAASCLRTCAAASSLFIAETTVKTHVAHILTKLDLADRARSILVW
jgi:DNA-binding NarL/FixJ family response regulator